MEKRSIFYSWQDDHPGKLNRGFIQDCVERAVKKLNREAELYDLLVDRDTRNVAGMPDIGHTVLEKIEKAAVVVADLTIINSSEVRRPNERAVSNPNVLFELGYAVGKRGTKRIVGVFNTAFGKVEELPFDLRPKRLMTFRLADGNEKTEVRNELVNNLTQAIRMCLGDSEEEQILRNSNIKRTLVELIWLGTEISEWKGVANLPQVLAAMRSATRELCGLMEQAEYPVSSRNIGQNISRKMEIAATVALNEENWPLINQEVESAGELARFLDSRMTIRLDFQEYKQCLESLRSMPLKLDDLANAILTDQLQLKEFDGLSGRLRTWAFFPLVPESPAFIEGLRLISLELRQCFLRWIKSKPERIQAAAVLTNNSARLTDLITKYCQADGQ